MMNWKRMGAWCGILAGVSFVILTFILMGIYPGGYDFFTNYFSQLGLSEINGIDTPFNWFLFAVATSLSGMLSIPFWISIRTVFMASTSLRAISGIGTAIGIVAGPCLAGVGIFAGDLFGPQHGWSTILFFILFAIAIAVYSVGIVLNPDYENIYALVGFIVCAICLGHIFIGGGALGQKIAVYSIVLYSMFQGYKLLKVFE
ncbi:MAG: DUF998 domain-containing protein [Candidatus Thorarchaeota archaeon]|jgi:hypothetical membrane protein